MRGSKNMKVFLINSSCNGSTGKIARSLCSVLKESGNEYFFAYGIGHYDDENSICLSNWVESHIHDQLSKITGKQGYFSALRTVQLIRKLKEENPDIIHLHNLHGNYLCLPILFKYLRNTRAKIIITMHDCWWFTGKCAWFTFVQCEKWKTGCGGCPQWGVYPKSYFFDRSKKCFEDKKKWLTSLGNRLTIVTPSEWLAGLVRESFLGEYPIKVINNGIDLAVFHPTDSDFRTRYGIRGGVKLILGVAFTWGKAKGLDVFVWLSENLPEDYQIVLVGTNDTTDRELPRKIISIHKTNDQHELAEIYTAVDVFVNPTREEVLGMTNIESLACGTPVVTFRTGGCPEIVTEECGIIVPYNNRDAMLDAVKYICEKKPFHEASCIDRAHVFAATLKYEEYLKLYEKT